MQCDRARQLLDPFIEGELGGLRAGELEAHLGSCAPCSSQLRGLRQTVAMVEGLPSLSPPPGLAARIMARVLRSGPALAPAKQGTLGWVLAAVFGALGALVLYLYLGEQGWPWDAAVLEGSQPVGLEDLASLLVGVEVGVIIGVTLLFVALASLLVQLMGRELQSEHG